MSDAIRAFLFEKMWVAAEPQTTLLNWSVHQMVFPTHEKVSRHLVGDTIGGSARITSEIKHFDPKNRIITTRSGRIYSLQGAAGTSDDSEFISRRWKQNYQVISDTDVTDEYVQAIRKFLH